MPPTRPPGSEIPSTLMGPGWRGRSGSHQDDVTAGEVWAPCSVRSSVSRLRAVLLTWPGDELAHAGTPSDWLMDARPDLGRMRAEAEGIGAFYNRHDVAVHWIRPAAAAPPNLVFACDLFFMTPEGAILGRMAAQQRAAEPRVAARTLASAGVAILATPRGDATFEGADAIWLADDLAMVGVGRRTNEAGYRVVERTLGDQGLRALLVDVPPTAQHLLGSVNPIAADLAVSLCATDSARRALASVGMQVLDFLRDEETVGGRSLNFVTLAPREIVMPAGNPRTRARLEGAGVRCHELPIREYLAAAGGLGCLTGILWRA